MKKKLINFELVECDYVQKNNKHFKHINFLDKLSKSKVYVSKTGLVCHKPNINTKQSLKVWSKKIFSKKIDTKRRKYSSLNPIMMSRHYYSALFFKNYLKKNSLFCDFGTGEGNFLVEMFKLRNDIKLYFVEDSKYNFEFTKKRFKKLFNKKINGFNGSIEEFSINKNTTTKFDNASLIWTLCNCVNPIAVLNNIHKSLKKNGLLLVSESSRIMVPFKKPIHNFFNSKINTNNTHPWFFSYNSLSNLLEICGFRIVYFNRYYDENDLIVIAKKVDTKYHRPKIKFDNFNKVIKFLKDWKLNSTQLNKL